MQRCEYKSASDERQSRWYACEQRRPLGLTEHWYEGDAEKDVSGGKHQILHVGRSSSARATPMKPAARSHQGAFCAFRVRRATFLNLGAPLQYKLHKLTTLFLPCLSGSLPLMLPG